MELTIKITDFPEDLYNDIWLDALNTSVRTTKSTHLKPTNALEFTYARFKRELDEEQYSDFISNSFALHCSQKDDEFYESGNNGKRFKRIIS